MKKLFAFVLSFALLLSLGAASASASSADEHSAEKWYGRAEALPVTLTLRSDGGYSLDAAGERKTGVWEARDGGVALDGEENASFLRVGDVLIDRENGLVLRQSEPAPLYTPAEPLSGVPQELFNGYWKSLYADADGALLPAEDFGDRTDLFVEAPRAALGGALFGDVVVDMVFADDALRYEAGEVSIVLQLQTDGFLRMTLAGPEGELLLYLLPTHVDGLTDGE